MLDLTKIAPSDLDKKRSFFKIEETYMFYDIITSDSVFCQLRWWTGASGWARQPKSIELKVSASVQ
jgi:hypothetical protein